MSGVVANIALLVYVLLLLSILRYLDATLTLPGIAGVILSMGFAVDANILIFERFKEEVLIGKSLRTSMEAGFKRAFNTILDANVSVMIAAIVLIVMGSGTVKGFAVNLALGIIVSMFTAIIVSRSLLTWFINTGLITNPWFYGLNRKPPEHMLKRGTEMKFSIVAHKMVVHFIVCPRHFSVISIFVNGFNFGIDYTGGTILDMEFNRPVTVAEVRQVVNASDLGIENSVIQLSGVTDQDSSQDVMIRMRNLSSDESKAVADALTTKLGGGEVKRTESVGAVIGSEVTKNAIMNLAVAFIALAAYITFRFEYKIAISALVSILHDLIMVLGVFSFFHLEIDATFLAAILTVVGYSMNEAVVIFDRVRENTRTHRRTDTYESSHPIVLPRASIVVSIR